MSANLLTIYLHPSITMAGGRSIGKNLQIDQLPKKMRELAEALKTLNPGRDVTAEDIATVPNKALRNRAMNAMVRTLTPEQKYCYDHCKDDKDRHQWVAEYILDPKKVKCNGASSVSRSATTTESEKTIWITEDELAGPSYLNSKPNAASAIKSLVSRPHENVALAGAGVKQYQWTLKEHTFNRSIEEAATIDSFAEMSAEQGQVLRDHMSNSGNPGEESTRPLKKARTNMLPIEDRKKAGDERDKDLSPEKKAHKDAETAYQKALTALKTIIDKVSKDLWEVKIIEVNMSKKRWDTTAQVAWLRAETNKVVVKKERYLERPLMGTFVWAGHAL
jgi:hypothetical protein